MVKLKLPVSKYIYILVNKEHYLSISIDKLSMRAANTLFFFQSTPMFPREINQNYYFVNKHMIIPKRCMHA
jgi:hypothetical protein